MKINDLQEWISKNLFRKDGYLDSNKLSKNGIKIKEINPKVYDFIFKYTKFLDKIAPTMSQRIYHIMNDMFYIIKCKECSKPVTFKKYNSGYNTFCSSKCAGNNLQVRNKTKETNIEKYGCEYVSQNEEIKQKRNNTIYKRWGVTNVSKHSHNKTKITNTWNNKTEDELKNISKKRQETYYNQTGFHHPLQNPEINNKIKTTCLEKYGVESPFQSDEVIKRIKSKRTPLKEKKRVEKCKKTWNQKYGVENPLQNSLIAEKVLNGYKNSWHDYKLPSGKIIKLQGYEPQALDILLEKYTEEEVLYKRSDMPEIWYKWDKDDWHRYYPDFYIPKENLVIEVKSIYTYEVNKNINILKKEATECLEYDYKLYIINK